MPNNIIARKAGQWLVVSMVPDICNTPVGSTIVPIPYPVIAKLGSSKKTLPHVKANGDQLLTISGHIPTTLGDQLGVKKGLKSDTVGGAASYKKGQHSHNVRAGKQPILRHGDLYWMNGKAPTAPPRKPPKNPVDERKQRYQERQELMAQTASSNDPKVREANERLALNNDNILRAEAAQYVYKVDEYNRGHIAELPEPPVGLVLQNPADTPGLENAIFTDKESGFGAALFKSEINGETMLTYRGTNNGVTGKMDWITNLAQGAGKETTQYNQAMYLAEKTQRSVDGSFTIVGHSLGGGLASAGVAVTGANGYTFNSAGLHPNTAARRGGLNNSQTAAKIISQHVSGEVLTGAQKYANPLLTTITGGIGAHYGGSLGGIAGAALGGLLIPKVPEAVGEMKQLDSINGGNPIARHGMDQVIDGIEAQKTEDINILQGAAA